MLFMVIFIPNSSCYLKCSMKVVSEIILFTVKISTHGKETGTHASKLNTF